METANEIMKQVVPIMMIPVNRYLRYLISCTKYVKEMGIKMTELNDARVGVEEHMAHNTSSHLEVPSQVEGWLEDVGKIKAKVRNVPTHVGGCFDLKTRNRAGRLAFNIIEEIDSAMKRHSLLTWTDRPIPLGRVDSKKASTSTPLTQHNDFPSREEIFTEALKKLGPNHKSHMIALCGMGGVGKTTMMQRLKKVAEQNRMFNYIAEVIIGEKPDSIVIQDAIASYLSIELKETIKSARAERLRTWFTENSDRGRTKFLIVLDDIWKSFDLNDIGLTPLPNQGVDFKILLTSRDMQVCGDMGTEVSSIFKVNLLSEVESQSLFQQVSGTVDPKLHKIGEDIVNKCRGLPIAIKTMACTLKNKRKDAWHDALSRLEHHNINDVVNEVFKLSYDNLQCEETKSIFLLCGLYPEDFNIPTEELVRYGWGLKLFKKVFTIREARARLNTCIERLIYTNLLMESDVGCVKMHDLVLGYVVDMFSKVEHATIASHSSMLVWPEDDMHDLSCKRISLTCTNISEFSKDLKFPNLLILKLMYGYKSLRFPQDFYRQMEKLQVISYDKMKYPLLPLPPQFSPNLRVLHLHRCSLMMFDCSSIGNLSNLEVLSFANSDIEWLPSTIGNLEKLRLLDLTNCCGIRIDNGVLKKLVKLEELYMSVRGRHGNPISFTKQNCNEIAERSKNLSALEIDFVENDALLKHISFGELQRFKISVGSFLRIHFKESKHSTENTLLLITNKAEVLESKMNKLFEKTEVLGLAVGDINDLEELVEVECSHPLQYYLFYSLRVLVISECAELRYLFTPGVANTLSNLEYLEVNKCDNMKELIHARGGEEVRIIFPKLKFLSLIMLPELLDLCRNANIIELPELVELELYNIPGFTSIYPKNSSETSSFLREDQVAIPKMEKLCISRMKNLKEIWPYEFSTSKEVKLKEIKISSCGNLVNMFPCNTMSLLHHLEVLRVEYCDSIEVLFHVDLDSVGEIGEGSSLRIIKVLQLRRLREVWRIKGEHNSHLDLIHGFQAVESIHIRGCERFINVFTPTTTNFDLGALIKISIENCGGENEKNNQSAESSQGEKQINVQSKEGMSQVSDSIFNIVFPSSLVHPFHNLHVLRLSNYRGVGVVFEIESPKGRELVTTHGNQQQLLPNLEELDLHDMDSMSHVWKGNMNKFLILQNQQFESPFHNLTTIKVYNCKSIKYLFSPFMAKLLSNLKKVKVELCDGIQEVVSNTDNEYEDKTTFTSTSSHTSTTLFPHLDSLELSILRKLKCIGGDGDGGNNEMPFNTTTITTAFVDQFKFSQAGGFSWSLCQWSREIDISVCHALSSVIPSHAAGHMQKLQVLRINYCSGMKEVFETQGINNNNNDYDEGNGGTPGIPRLNNVIVLPNLKILYIERCDLLEHIFTFSTLESLKQLQEFTIKECQAIKVIVKEEEDDGQQTTTKASSKVVVFPRLKSITLEDLPELTGFFLGKIEFQWPSLDYVMIKRCPKMMVSASRGSTTPKLKYIHTTLGKHSLEKWSIAFHVTTTAQHQTPLLSLNCASSCPATSEGKLGSFHNLIELHVKFNDVVGKIIPSNELLQLQKLEKIYIEKCWLVEEVFEELEARRNNSGESQTTVVKLPNLRTVDLNGLSSLMYIWKSNQWTTFEFPNLTSVSIYQCKKLRHVFTSSMVGSLLQLRELCIVKCDSVTEVILIKDENVVIQAEEEEESDGKMKEILLPCLKSLAFKDLPSLGGFCLGKKDFSFPLLDTLIMEECTRIAMFTNGHSATPQLKEIGTGFGSFYAGEGEDINSFIKAKQEEFERDEPSWM